MLGWFAKKTLVASWDWIIRWSDASPDKGAWLMYEDKYGRRSFHSTHTLWILDSKEKNLPGFSEMCVWKAGGALPEGAKKP